MRIVHNGGGAGESAARRLSPRTLATIVLANALEFFDYFCYATFSAFITAAFLPQATHAYASLLSLGAFAAGFLSRPIGAFLIGTYADTRGRKPALLLTSALVTAGTLGLAAIPDYATLGLGAPIAVLACRILQGIAIGGEMGSSSALLIEHCAPARKNTYAGWLMAGQGLALMMAGACGIALYALLTSAQMAQWGWRVPFALASALIPVQIYLRRHIDERWQATGGKTPLGRIVMAHPRQWLISIVLIFGGTVPTYVATYTTTFGIGGARPSAYAAFVTTAAVGAVTLVLSIAGGRLGDRFGSLRTVVLSRLLTMAVVLPAFHFAQHRPDAATLLCVVALFAGLSALAGGPSIVVILGMFPVRGRAVAMSLVYAVGVALFGGTAPLVVASVDLWAGTHVAAAWYIFVSAAITVLTVVSVRVPHAGGMPAGR